MYKFQNQSPKKSHAYVPLIAPKKHRRLCRKAGHSIYITLNSLLSWLDNTFKAEHYVGCYELFILWCTVCLGHRTLHYLNNKACKKDFSRQDCVPREICEKVFKFFILFPRAFTNHARSLFENNILQKERKVQRAAGRATSSSCYTHFSR
jgi:hypothetical protein